MTSASTSTEERGERGRAPELLRPLFLFMELFGVCFRDGGVDGRAWGAVSARGAAWCVGLISADFGQAAARGRIHLGLAARKRHPLAR